MADAAVWGVIGALTQEQPVSCRACGAGVSEDALFCSRCGARVDEALAAPERRIVTALFCDLVGSTELAERTDPEELDRLLRRYYGLAREAIERHGGTIEKFIGDAVAALFGFPLAHEDDPERAVRAALDIVQRIRSDEIGLQVRVAVETGEAFVRDAAQHHGFAAGDVMNTAARLQSAAEPMSVIVGPRARTSAARGFEFAEMPPLRLKGKQAPVRAALVVRPRAASASPALSVHLVGRERELGELRSVVRDVTEGAGAVVLVEGEPGIGKSQLVAEVRAASEVLWLRGRSVETRDAAGYRPFAEQICSWAGTAPGWDALVAKALALGLTRRDAAFLAALAGIEPDSEAAERLALLDPEALQPALYRSIWTWLNALAAARPVVLEFEDWHWADGASVQLLEHVAALVGARPLLLLVISRPGPATERALSRVPGGLRRLQVAPLAQEEAGRLLDELVSGHDIGPERLRAALTRAEGNPYFLHELARLIAEQTGVADLPDTVRAVVTSRVDRLPAGLRTLLRSAAVLGRTFESELLERLDGYGPVSEALGQLAATQLVERAGQDRYRFAHALTREAVYEGIPLAERRRLHKKAAGALADVHGAAASSLPAIAYHLAQAQDWDAAASALVAAGEQAARIASDDEALQMYRAAIAAHERLAEDRWTPLERSRIDRQIAEALERLGRHEEASRQIAGALTRLGLRLPQDSAAVKRAMLRQLLPRMLRQPSLPPPGAPLDESELEIDRELHIHGWIAYFEDFDMVALDALLLAHRAARANDLEGIAVGSFSVALLFAVLGRERLAMGYVSRALQAAERHGDPLTLAQARQGGAVVALAQGGWDDVRMLTEPAMHVSAEVGDLRVWAASAALLMTAAAHHGDLARARELAAEVERAGAESGNLQIHGWGLGFLGLVNHLEGDAEAAVQLAEASVAELRRVPDHLNVTIFLGALARAQLRAGHPDAAASTIAHVSAEVEQRGFRGLYTAYQVEAAAEYALLSLATDNSAATRKAARRAIRGSLGRRHVARWHIVHAHALDGGMQWVLGQERRAERSFARAQTVAQQYQWHGTLHDAASWVAYCCAAAGIGPPALPAYALPRETSARDLASATGA
jgi:class 3 adenylate cyclase/tetratricopeptide (TPR) repeat protein